MNSWEVDLNANFTDVSLEPIVKTYKTNFTHGYSEIIHAFRVTQNEYPNDVDLEVLTGQVTRKMKVTKKAPNSKENYTIPKATWNHLEPHI